MMRVMLRLGNIFRPATLELIHYKSSVCSVNQGVYESFKSPARDRATSVGTDLQYRVLISQSTSALQSVSAMLS